MTVWGASDADFQDQETLAAAGVTPPDRYAIRFRHRLAGGWSGWLYVKTRSQDGSKLDPHSATESVYEAGIHDLHDAQMRHIAFSESVRMAGVSLDAVQVEIIEYPAETIWRDWQRAFSR